MPTKLEDSVAMMRWDNLNLFVWQAWGVNYVRPVWLNPGRDATVLALISDQSAPGCLPARKQVLVKEQRE